MCEVWMEIVWIAIDKDNEYFFHVKPTVAPTLFWHHFPPSAGLNNFFVNATQAAYRNGSKGKRKAFDAKTPSSVPRINRIRLSSDVEGSSSDGQEGASMVCL
jgi:hypothetical protein